MGFSDFFFGSPAEYERKSTLLPNQQPLLDQLTNAGQKRGAGGAFGTTADYYRYLMSNNSADYQAFANPMLRQYNEDIIPGISEQFAGMGSGSLGSSGFRNAQIQGATDLSERLGALRAQLRQQGAQGLAGIGQMGLGNYSENVMTQQGTQGALPGLVGAAGTLIGGPVAGAIGAAGANWLTNKMSGQTSPYQQNPVNASPGVSARYK